jgi:hypothetical protein
LMPEFVMTEDDLTPEMLREAGRGDVRVVFSMSDRDELWHLVDDSADDARLLADALVLAWEAAHGPLNGTEDVSWDDEEEGDVWAWYVRGFELDEVRAVVAKAIPEGFTVLDVPVSPNAYSDAQLAIVRR